MIELKGLEDWARGMLATPISTLNRLYGTSRKFGNSKKQDELTGALKKTLEELPFFSRFRPVFRHISEQTLRDLFLKIREQKCEISFCNILSGIINQQMPDEIAFDLIERNVGGEWRARSLLSEAVLWHLVPTDSDAHLALVAQYYYDRKHSVEKFEAALYHDPEDYHWMLDYLSLCWASSLEKRRVYDIALESHPEREQLLRNGPYVRPDFKMVGHYDLDRLSYKERIEAFYGDYNFEKLFDIARNDQTPDEILRELEELHGFPDASAIRAAARRTLWRREESSPK